MKDATPSSLSKRGQYTFSQRDFLALYLDKSGNNVYHPEKNPEGVINFGTAVDRLMEDEMQQRLANLGAFHFKASEHQHYYDFRGKYSLRMAIANFLKKHFNAAEDISPENLIVQSGTSSCLDSLSYALFDPGDVYITPTPTYGRIFTNFNDRSLARPVPLVLPEQPDSSGKRFALTAELLENRIQELKRQGKHVKGFVLINPQNPLGDVYSQHLLRSLLDVCAEHKIHVILDEIYALTLLDCELKISSVLSVPNIPDPMRTHFVWALSKDFGLAGVRLGVIHTKNSALLKVLKDLSFYCPTASIVQDMATSILNDTAWLDEVFFPHRRQRLEEKHSLVKNTLENMGITVESSKGGLFVWFDLKRYLRSPTNEAEMELFEELFERGVYIVPGTQFHCQTPGWFRMVFTLPNELIVKGLQRLDEVLKRRSKIYAFA